MTKEATDFGLYATRSLPGFKVGQSIDLQGKQYTITGWKARAQKTQYKYHVMVDLIEYQLR